MLQKQNIGSSFLTFLFLLTASVFNVKKFTGCHIGIAVKGKILIFAC